MRQGQAPPNDLSFIPSSLQVPDEADLNTIGEISELSGGVYPYSVIPGGVHSAEEFAAKRESDPVVAEHYGDVSMATLRVEHVTEPRSAYMSYRINDRIYWTKNKLPLREGETILTDGETTIRGRCGNGVSDLAMMPVSDEEPEASVFDRRIDGSTTTAVAGVWGNSYDDIANDMGAVTPGGWALSGGGPTQFARANAAPFGGGSGGSDGGGSGGGGQPFASPPPDGSGPQSTTRGTPSTSPGDDNSTNPDGGGGSNASGSGGGSNASGGGGGSNASGGGGGSNASGGGGGSNASGGGGGSNASGGGGGSNASGGGGGANPPGGGDGSNPPGNSSGPTNPGGGGVPDTFAFGDNLPLNGNPFVPGDLPVGDGPSDLGSVSVNVVEPPPQPVPEPSSILLLAGGLTGYALKRIRARRRRN